MIRYFNVSCMGTLRFENFDVWGLGELFVILLRFAEVNDEVSGFCF